MSDESKRLTGRWFDPPTKAPISPAADCDMEKARIIADDIVANPTGHAFSRQANVRLARCFKAQAEALGRLLTAWEEFDACMNAFAHTNPNDATWKAKADAIKEMGPMIRTLVRTERAKFPHIAALTGRK